MMRSNRKPMHSCCLEATQVMVRLLAVVGMLTLSSPSLQAQAIQQQATGTADVTAIATEIRDAATRDVSNGHPLPLLASWNTGVINGFVGFDARYQLQRIAQGDYLLPWFQLFRPDELSAGFPFENAFRKAAELKLPVSFISTQWDVLVAEEIRDRADTTGSALRGRQSLQKTQPLSPFSPVSIWYEAGQRWGEHPALQRLQAIYPDPPLVLFVSNNEQPRLMWREIRDSEDVRQRLGMNASDDAIRKLVGDLWIERFQALQRGFREALINPQWQQQAVFVGYDAFVTSAVGRWAGWSEYSLITASRLDPWALAWDGISPSYYAPDWNPTSDFQVMSPQLETMNWLPFLDEAYRLNPRLWFELSIWDGQQQTKATDKAAYYRRLGQHYDENRYQGFVQFGMWLLRPRLVREFRDHLATRYDFSKYFNSAAKAVRKVHETPELRRFWTHGQLVANTQTTHPYNAALPTSLKQSRRWYLLDSNLNPPRPWSLDTSLRVYSIALSLGIAPHREWLIYAFSPLDEGVSTTVTIPQGPMTDVQASRTGCFSILDETAKKTQLVSC